MKTVLSLVVMALLLPVANNAANGCRFLFPGWWRTVEVEQAGAGNSRIFPLADSRFSAAIRDFLASCPDEPLQ